MGLALNGRAALAEAALQAPWRQAIAFARVVKRTVQAEKRGARAVRRAAWAAKRVVGAVTSAGQGRGKSGETGAVRLNPVQLSHTGEDEAGRSCGNGARGGSPQGAGLTGSLVGMAFVAAGRGMAAAGK